ncbi:MAG: alpha/beta hydrolase [Candidatus Ornithospirochaeta sp.]|nr:alpha/beta hydrolase [Candidatus Ornithospirochaeta sp.]
MRRTAYFIAALAVFFISCSSPEASGTPDRVLDVGEIDPRIIAEDGYSHSMKTEAEPFLDSIRTEGYLTANGHRIHYAYYDIEEEKGSVVIFHGLAEFIPKYNEAIYYLVSSGYDVYMPEHFGHGYSSRSKGIGESVSKIAVDSFDVYVSDAKAFIDEIVLPRSGDGKLILFSHSLGGGIGIRFLETYPDVFDGAVLSSPMSGIVLPGIPESLAYAIAASAAKLGFGSSFVFGHHEWDGNERFNAATSYPRYLYSFQMRLDDEHYRTCGATWSWLYASIGATRKMLDPDEAARIRVPVLLMQADDDTLVRNDSHYRLASMCSNIEIVLCPGSKHEIFLSEDAVVSAYWDEVIGFMDGIE